jgi:hypothetical protein
LSFGKSKNKGLTLWYDKSSFLRSFFYGYCTSTV